ncbi:hypothetical protein D3C71_2184010 [compost metagenome]
MFSIVFDLFLFSARISSITRGEGGLRWSEVPAVIPIYGPLDIKRAPSEECTFLGTLCIALSAASMTGPAVLAG